MWPPFLNIFRQFILTSYKQCNLWFLKRGVIALTDVYICSSFKVFLQLSIIDSSTSDAKLDPCRVDGINTLLCAIARQPFWSSTRFRYDAPLHLALIEVQIFHNSKCCSVAKNWTSWCVFVTYSNLLHARRDSWERAYAVSQSLLTVAVLSLFQG